MKVTRLPFDWRTLGVSALLLSLLVPAHAQLFGGDDEARRAIINLRERVEVNHNRLDADIKALTEEIVPLRRGVLDLSGQLDSLRSELAILRGQNEQLTRELAVQRELLQSMEQRLRPLEPRRVSLDGIEFSARAEEVQAFELAMNAIRASDFSGAARLFQTLTTQFPHSGYVPTALYWQGNAFYAAREYQQAIASYQRMIQAAPRHPRAPEAQLAIANCHLELRDAAAMRKALQQLVEQYPESEAAATARDRLARIR
jgi:tol-pal system protein YbgF